MSVSSFITTKTTNNEYDIYLSKFSEKEKPDEFLFYPTLLKAIETGNTDIIEHIAIDLDKQHLITTGNAFEAAISANQYHSLLKLIELGAQLFTESEITPLDLALDRTFPLSSFSDEDLGKQVRLADTRVIKLITAINPLYHNEEMREACMDIVLQQMKEEASAALQSIAAKSHALNSVLNDQLPFDIQSIIFQYATEEEEELVLDRYRATNVQIKSGSKSIDAKAKEIGAVLHALSENELLTILEYSIENQEEMAYQQASVQ